MRFLHLHDQMKYDPFHFFSLVKAASYRSILQQEIFQIGRIKLEIEIGKFSELSNIHY